MNISFLIIVSHKKAQLLIIETTGVYVFFSSFIFVTYRDHGHSLPLPLINPTKAVMIIKRKNTETALTHEGSPAIATHFSLIIVIIMGRITPRDVTHDNIFFSLLF